MLKLDTEAELVALHEGIVKESLYLEYKASGAIDKKDDSKKLEIARDVSAFANSMGGQIIYAMTEKDHAPAGLDSGIDPKTYPTLWFEQILQQHITPNLSGLDIKHIPLSNKSMVAVRITIPAGTGDPHQVSDGKYYRRHSFNRLAMDHYEIKGLFYRTTTPDLFLTMQLSRGDNTALEFTSQSDHSQTVSLSLAIGNRSNQPAFHTVVKIGVDASIDILNSEEFTGAGRTVVGNVKQNWVMRAIMTPPSLPLFREAEIELGSLRFRFHERMLASVHRLRLSTIIQTPGQYVEEDWFLHLEGMHLRLLEPGHPLTR